MVSNPFAQLDHIERLLGVVSGSLADINRKVDHVLRHLHVDIEELILDRAQLDRLISATTANTDATKSAAAALTAYVASNAELTAKLKTALDELDADTDGLDEVKAAADAIEANNQTLKASIPQVAAAVTDNTPAATS